MVRSDSLKNKLICKIICTVLIAVTCFGIINVLTSKDSYSNSVEVLWDGVSVSSSFSAGNGTLENPYIINNGADFAYFKYLIENNDIYNDKYYALGDNVNLNNHDFEPIGSENGIFKGHFDGRGFTIRNVNISNSQVIENVNYYGLFSTIDTANIVNLNVDNIVINTSNSDKVSKVGTLVASVIGESELNNISIYKSGLNLDGVLENEGNMIGGFIANVLEGTNIYNVYLDILITADDTSLIGEFSHTFLGTANNIISNVKLNTTLDYEISSFVSNEGEINNLYKQDDEYFILNDEKTDINSMILLLNDSLDLAYTWEFNDVLMIVNETSKMAIEEFKAFAFSPLQTVTLHDSGIDLNNGIIYINDLVSDKNYYKGLNYTSSASGTLPTGVNQNIYNDSNLAKFYIQYSGSDIDGQNTGYVSLTEQVSKFNYYKYYPVVDGYATFELIDHPFGDRPNNMAFNGWITDDPNVFIWYDSDIHTYYAKVPVDDVSKEISITFYAHWIEAFVGEVTGTNSAGWTAALDNLKDSGFYMIGKIPVYDSARNYYTQGKVNRYRSYPSGAVNASGARLSGTCRTSGGCTYYIHPTSATVVEGTTYYSLINGTMTVVSIPIIRYDNDPDAEISLPSGLTAAGYYKAVTVARNTSLSGYYNADGVYLDGGTCTSSSGCQVFERIPYYDDAGNVILTNDSDVYGFFVTRDTNILVLRANNSSRLNTTKPLTLTTINNGTDYNNYLDLRSTYLRAGADLRVEYITIRTSVGRDGDATPPGNATTNGGIYGNLFNLKVGRGVVSYNTYCSSRAVIGSSNGTSTGSAGNVTRYKTIIESGRYNNLSVVNGYNSGGTYYIDAVGVYGNDYDRIAGDNSSLDVYATSAGNWGGSIYGETDITPAITTIVKSGSFGTSKYDYATGIYVGGLNYGTLYAPRQAIIEGGYIFNLLGGPLSAGTREGYNDIYMNIKGGSIDLVFGGAGRTETFGNRIVNLTGGQVNYAVFGGSNGYSGSNSNSSRGTLTSSTFVYVGGNSVVGDPTIMANGDDWYGEEIGSVFGIGNGNDDYDMIGTATNSYVIVDDGATVNNNVYGGGNYGAVGINNDSTTSTTMKILGGTINGSVYGGGNNNGSGASSVKSTIDITMTGGTVNGSVYGGSKTNGIVYGDSNVKILGGTIGTDVYGGGQGGYVNNNNKGTYVSQKVDVVVGNLNDSTPININGSVYGGSAYGTVNGTSNSTTSISKYSTNVTVNSGTIKQNVFGGGKGGRLNNTNFTPYVLGNVIVNINGGNIGNVYGGNDAAGEPNGTDVVYLSGGTIGNCFGGGNATGQKTTDIRLQGSSIVNLFGGSNSSGTVNTSNVTVTSGNVSGNIYGGNNIGGVTTNTNVNVTGINSLGGDIYGGGSLANCTTSNVDIGSVTVNNVYGGGERASVGTTDVSITGVTGKKVFGGSNISGDVSTSKVLINSGSFDSVYGGNNQGGTTGVTNVDIKSGTIGNVFGGGDNAVSTTSNISIYDGNITNVFGGGNEAGLTTSNVDIYKGNIVNVFGGSNNAGDVSRTNVNTHDDNDDTTSTSSVLSVSLTGTATQAQNWQSTTFSTYVPVTFAVTNTSDVLVEDWLVQLNFPTDTTIFANYSSSEFTIDNGVAIITPANKWYAPQPFSLDPGETYTFNFEILTNTSVSNFQMTANVLKPIDATYSSIVIGNLYGGNNLGGTAGNCFINIDEGDIGSLYGGGNEALVNSTNVDIDNAYFNVIYGGGNAAGVNTSTYIDVDDSVVKGNIYGGGNEGTVSNNTELYLTNTSVDGSSYAGGNGSTAIVYGNTTITIDGNSVIGTEGCKAPHFGSVFGSGNAAATGSSSTGGSIATVNITGATIYGNVYGGANTSVVYGKTLTNIGTTAVNNNSLTEGDIVISGTVFGGGEANAEGSEIYDFEAISVTEAINIYIDGTGYIANDHKFLMNGSIFGSGNASSSSGTSDILIKNLGTRDAPSKNISIQRANTVVLDNTVIELVGTTDRTNDYSSIKYSFNRIDLLTIKNNTMLMLKQNANLLKEFRSMVDINGSEVPAKVSIDPTTHKVTKNVDNRLYLMPNRNLNITTNQAATAYGRVTGMTFFGMYNSYDASGTFQYGAYDDSIETGSQVDASDAIIGGSYVMGLHHANHNIETDGFYTNYLSDDYTSVTTAYIEPTPPDAGYYMWAIGIQAVNYSVDLNASKYSSLGTLELSMPDFSDGDTTFHVIGFNSEGLKNNVQLVEPTTVPKVTQTPEEANQIFGLSMKTETREWTSYGTTKFYSNSDVKYSGDLTYKTDSQTVAPSLMFYLYHAKNITLNEDIGSVVVSLHAITPKNEIESELQLITITVNITAKDFDDGDYYDASITYDKKYEMPSATSVNITNQSQFTAYYSIFSYADSFEDFYGKDNSNYHTLITNRALPVGTQITMIDIGVDEANPKYYYYTVDQNSYNNAVNQLNTDGEIAYKLSDFIRMGSIDSDNTYDDAESNLTYYSTEYNRVMEEFIFIFDFKETTTTGTYLANSMLFELRNKEDRNLIPVLGIRQNLMFYSTYDSSNVVLNETVTSDSEYLYYDLPVQFNLATEVAYDQTENSEAIINTNYESNSMGWNVSVIDSTGMQVSSSMLTGTNIKIDNINYFADSDGVFRIKLAGKVSNINRVVYITTDKMLPSGTYTLRFTLFASADGRHNSHLLEADSIDIPVTVVGSDNSIIVECDDRSKLVHGETGLNELGLSYNEYTISTNSVLSNPNVRISVYKRNIDNKDTTIYTEVPIGNLFSNYFLDVSSVSQKFRAASEFEKYVNITVGKTSTLKFNLVSDLTSGTYKVVFKLYDTNQLIEEEVKYVIVRKNVE